MKKVLMVMMIATLFLSLGLTGCAQKKATSSSEAIKAANDLPDVKQKVDYLVGQAKAFYNSKEFQQAIDVAQYVLAKLDANSQEAKNLLEKAKTQLTATAKQAVSDVQKKLGF